MKRTLLLIGRSWVYKFQTITQVLLRAIEASFIALSRSLFLGSTTTRVINWTRNKRTLRITWPKGCKYRTRDRTVSQFPRPTHSKSHTEGAVSWWLKVLYSRENLTILVIRVLRMILGTSRSRVPKRTVKGARLERASCSHRLYRYPPWAPRVDPKVQQRYWLPIFRIIWMNQLVQALIMQISRRFSFNCKNLWKIQKMIQKCSE